MDNLRVKKIKTHKHYFISCCGKVFNKHKKELKFDSSNGYYRIELSDNGVKQKHFVHVLVAMHFCRGYSPDKIVNHKDHDKFNCHYKNLECITQSENIKKYYIFKKKFSKIKTKVLKSGVVNKEQGYGEN